MFSDCACSINGLAGLCLVLRKLNELAIRRLYRNIDCIYTKGWQLLARTFIERRDLAGLGRDLDIQELKVPDAKDLPLEVPEVAAYYVDQLNSTSTPAHQILISPARTLTP